MLNEADVTNQEAGDTILITAGRSYQLGLIIEITGITRIMLLLTGIIPEGSILECI
jgi:hypothetical protein